LHRFRDIAFDMSNVSIFGYPSCVLPPTEGFPSEDLRKILHDGQWIARIQNGIETLPSKLPHSEDCMILQIIGQCPI